MKYRNNLFRIIKMKNFEKDIENATDKELYTWVNNLDFRVVPLASDELTRRSIKEMIKSINVFNNKSSGQTKRLIILTIIMTIGLIIQILLAIY